MKKIFLLLSIVSVFGLTGCNSDDDKIDYDTYPEVFEPQNAINFVASGNYQSIIPLNPKIPSTSSVLVYRLAGANNFGNDIWESIPTSYDLAEGTLKYFFDFSQDDVVIYLDADFDPGLRQDFSLNQIFRIVIIPSYVAQNLSSNNYDTVMSAIKDSNKGTAVEIKTIK